MKFDMMRCAAFALLVVAAPRFSQASTGSPAGCRAFHGNITHEVTLFGTKALPIDAATASTAAPVIETNRLYDVHLAAESRVHFAHAPGKAMLVGGDSAGLLRLSVRSAGVYRVSVDAPFWLDLVVNGRLVTARDFSGSPTCPGPHKAVEFALPRGRATLQLSGYIAKRVRLTVTRVGRPMAHRPTR